MLFENKGGKILGFHAISVITPRMSLSTTVSNVQSTTRGSSSLRATIRAGLLILGRSSTVTLAVNTAGMMELICYCKL